jgi:hypothetical protein
MNCLFISRQGQKRYSSWHRSWTVCILFLFCFKLRHHKICCRNRRFYSWVTQSSCVCLTSDSSPILRITQHRKWQCILIESNQPNQWNLPVYSSLFHITTATYFGNYMPSSGSIWVPSELLVCWSDWVVDKLVCRSKIYVTACPVYMTGRHINLTPTH